MKLFRFPAFSFLFLIFVTVAVAQVTTPAPVPLWPQGAPGALGDVSPADQPRITPFPAPKIAWTRGNTHRGAGTSRRLVCSSGDRSRRHAGGEVAE